MNKLDTSTPILPPEASTTAPVVWHRRRWVRIVALVAGLLGILLGLMSVIPVGVLGDVVPGTAIIDQSPVALKPGRARPVDKRVTIDSSHVYEPKGQVLFTTVSIDDNVTVLEWLNAERDPYQTLLPHDAVFGARSATENRTLNLQMMQVSKDTAVLVAFQRLGVDVVDDTGIIFSNVVSGGPSAGVLKVGDVIVAINGAPITDFDSLKAALANESPGDEIVITLEDGETHVRRDETITLGAHPDDASRPFIGISGVGTRVVQRELPFDVSIDSGKIGGPSAGLAFTLSIIDLLTPGELTGGGRVAVTGTISLDETVGDVGGAEQKAVGARKAGAEVFIVPKDEVADAEKGAGDMPVVGVTTLDDALNVLAGLGGQTTNLTLSGR